MEQGEEGNTRFFKKAESDLIQQIQENEKAEDRYLEQAKRFASTDEKYELKPFEKRKPEEVKGKRKAEESSYFKLEKSSKPQFKKYDFTEDLKEAQYDLEKRESNNGVLTGVKNIFSNLLSKAANLGLQSAQYMKNMMVPEPHPKQEEVEPQNDQKMYDTVKNAFQHLLDKSEVYPEKFQKTIDFKKLRQANFDAMFEEIQKNVPLPKNLYNPNLDQNTIFYRQLYNFLNKRGDVSFQGETPVLKFLRKSFQKALKSKNPKNVAVANFLDTTLLRTARLTAS
jgi:hypothetical protein